MKQKWEYKKLGDVATFINGYPFKPSEWTTEGLPIIRIQNLNNPFAEYNYFDKTLDGRYIVKSGDVLISWSGTLGVYEWSGKQALLNQHIFKVLFDKGKINKAYFKYVVSSRIEEMKSKVHGITMQHITKGDFDKTTIPVPPLDEQQRIVAELDLLTGIIDKQNAQLKELDTLAQSIFYDMFGDPIENPKGWEVKKFGFVAEFKNGLNFDPSENGVNYYLIGVSDFQQKSKLDCDASLKTVSLNSSLPEDYLLADDDILFVRSNGNKELIARNILVSTNGLAVTYSGFCIRARIKSDGLLPFFLNSLLKIPSAHNALTSKGHGCNIANLNQKTLDAFNVILPPLALQQSFADKIQSIEKQKSVINQSIVDTQKLLDYTMDKYFG